MTEMDNGMRYRLNEGKAAGKVIDGEAIVINAVTGRYYSLDEASCVAWVHLAGGSSLAETLAAIVSRYEVADDAASSDLAALAERLVAEELLVEAGSDNGSQLVDESGLPDAGGERRDYASLELLTFTDMEDLLAFDPPLPAVGPHEWEWRPE